jgi:hypothetical protein
MGIAAQLAADPAGAMNDDPMDKLRGRLAASAAAREAAHQTYVAAVEFFAIARRQQIPADIATKLACSPGRPTRRRRKANKGRRVRPVLVARWCEDRGPLLGYLPLRPSAGWPPARVLRVALRNRNKD